jgi:FixJ family two-component response regulator
VIERLARSLRELSVLTPDELASASRTRERADCADAVRLELDCMQKSLTTRERDVLSRLSDDLEARDVDGETLAASVQAAWDVLR